MIHEVVIRVPELPLPKPLVDSDEFQDLSANARHAVLTHVRYIQAIPYKLREWLNTGASTADLEALIHRVDLDLMIQLGVPKSPDDAMTPWRIRRGWVTRDAPLTTLLSARSVSSLNEPIPQIGAKPREVAEWIRKMDRGMSGLIEEFFQAHSFDHAVACLVAIYVSMAGLKYGLGRVGLQLPR